MRCPKLFELPPPPLDKSGWPWTEESQQLPDTTQDGTPWPKVSIVTPSYNQGRFLEESIRSVLLQGYPDLEYIIIDGGSTDESIEIIKKYEPWLAYWVSEPDRGQSHAINKGLKRSTGEFFNWHNADDMLTPNSVAVLGEVMIKNPEAGSVHGYRLLMDEQSRIQGQPDRLLRGKEGFILKLEWFVSNLKTHCQPGSLMRRALVLESGMIDEELHYVMDVDLGLRLALLKPPFYIDKPVVFYREYPQTKSSATAEKALERVMIAHKVFNRNNLPHYLYKLKNQSFATAHRFARNCYSDAEKYEYALWHLLCEIVYLPPGKWLAEGKSLLKLMKKMIMQKIKKRTRSLT